MFTFVGEVGRSSIFPAKSTLHLPELFLASSKQFSAEQRVTFRFVRHVAGSPIATLLHVAQKEEFEGDRSIARDRLRLDLPLPCNESDDIAWGSEGKEARYLSKPRRLLGKPQEGDRKLLLYMAQKMAGTRFRQMEASN